MEDLFFSKKISLIISFLFFITNISSQTQICEFANQIYDNSDAECVNCMYFNQYFDITSNQCITCPIYTQIFNITMNSCTLCPQPNQYYDAINNECAQYINNNQYYNISTNSSQNCLLQNQIFSINTNSCISCTFANQYFDITSNLCITCPIYTQIFSITTNSCIPCSNESQLMLSQYFNSTSDLCEVCPLTNQIYNSTTQTCQNCSSNQYFNNLTYQCTSCVGMNQLYNITSAQCQNCSLANQGDTFFNVSTNSCQACLSNQYYDINSNLCTFCDDMNIFNSTLLICAPCISGQIFNSYTNSCQLCYFENTTSLCEICDQSCIGCVGPTNMNCLICNTNYYMLNSQCVPINLSVFWNNPSIWPNQRVPSYGDIVYIPLGYDVILNTSTANLSLLIIDGQLTVNASDSLGLIQIIAENIIINQGKLLYYIPSNNNDNQYTRLQIVLIDLGVNYSPISLNLSDSTLNLQKKQMIVLGELNLSGEQRGYSWTKLTAYAEAGSIIIQVDPSINFRINDTIIITSTSLNSYEDEINIIIGSPSPGQFLLDSPLLYDHFGNNTIFETNIGNLDMRAEVGIISHDIQILGDPQTDGEGSIIVTSQQFNNNQYAQQYQQGYYSMLNSLNNQGSESTQNIITNQTLYSNSSNSSNTNVIVGSLNLTNVMINNCGPSSYALGYNQARGAIEFRNQSVNIAESNYIMNSSIINSQSAAVLFNFSTSVYLQNSVFFNNTNNTIRIINSYGLTINSNLIASNNFVNLQSNYIIMSSSVFLDDMTLAQQFFSSITNNIVSGEPNISYLLPAADQSTSPSFVNNIAHSSGIGWIAFQNLTSDMLITNFTAYKTQEGVMSYELLDGLMVQYLILSDNINSLSINMGTYLDSAIINMSNLFIGGSLLSSYANYTLSSSSECSNLSGIRLSVITSNEQPWPMLSQNGPFYRPSSDAIFNQSVIISNVMFGYFNYDPNGICVNNFMFIPNIYATDYTSFHTLSGISLFQANSSYVFNTQTPNMTGLNFFANNSEGFNYSGYYNYILRDISGLTTSAITSTINSCPFVDIIPNNMVMASVITNQNSIEKCSFQNIWNSYGCCGNGYGILMMEDIGQNCYTRSIAPIIVTNITKYSINNNQINGNPLMPFAIHSNNPSGYSTTIGTPRFPTLVISNQLYQLNLSNYDYQSSLQMRFQYQNRFDQPDAVIISIPLYFQLLFSVGFYSNLSYIQPIVRTPSSRNAAYMLKYCGDNYIDQKNILYIELTSDYDCVVMIESVTVLIVNTTFSTSYNLFMLNSNSTVFQNQLSQYLQIDNSQIMIISSQGTTTSSYSTMGSTVFSYYILPNPQLPTKFQEENLIIIANMLFNITINQLLEINGYIANYTSCILQQVNALNSSITMNQLQPLSNLLITPDSSSNTSGNGIPFPNTTQITKSNSLASFILMGVIFILVIIYLTKAWLRKQRKQIEINKYKKEIELGAGNLRINESSPDKKGNKVGGGSNNNVKSASTLRRT